MMRKGPGTSRNPDELTKSSGMLLLLFAILLHGCSGFAQPHAEKAITFGLDECGEPTLVEVPAGYRRLFLVRHGEVINPGGDRPVYYGCQVGETQLGSKS